MTWGLCFYSSEWYIQSQQGCCISFNPRKVETRYPMYTQTHTHFLGFWQCVLLHCRFIRGTLHGHLRAHIESKLCVFITVKEMIHNDSHQKKTFKSLLVTQYHFFSIYTLLLAVSDF